MLSKILTGTGRILSLVKKRDEKKTTKKMKIRISVTVLIQGNFVDRNVIIHFIHGFDC